MKTIAKFTGMDLSDKEGMGMPKEPTFPMECCPRLCLRGEAFEELPEYGEITFRFCKKSEHCHYSDEGDKQDCSVDIKLEQIVTVKADESKPAKTSEEALDELKDEMMGEMEDE
jgi:hypothetical protein